MIFYLEPKLEELTDYLADFGQYIGTLHCDNDENITKDDISFEKIQEKLKEDKFLVVVIFNKTWQLCMLFNTSETAAEIKAKYKECEMIWYWLERKYIKECLPNMQFKNFEKLFPKIEKDEEN